MLLLTPSRPKSQVMLAQVNQQHFNWHPDFSTMDHYESNVHKLSATHLMGNRAIESTNSSRRLRNTHCICKSWRNWQGQTYLQPHRQSPGHHPHHGGSVRGQARLPDVARPRDPRRQRLNSAKPQANSIVSQAKPKPSVAIELSSMSGAALSSKHEVLGDAE